jgi:hypothetical protein
MRCDHLALPSLAHAAVKGSFERNPPFRGGNAKAAPAKSHSHAHPIGIWLNYILGREVAVQSDQIDQSLHEEGRCPLCRAATAPFSRMFSDKALKVLKGFAFGHAEMPQRYPARHNQIPSDQTR